MKKMNRCLSGIMCVFMFALLFTPTITHAQKKLRLSKSEFQNQYKFEIKRVSAESMPFHWGQKRLFIKNYKANVYEKIEFDSPKECWAALKAIKLETTEQDMLPCWKSYRKNKAREHYELCKKIGFEVSSGRVQIKKVFPRIDYYGWRCQVVTDQEILMIRQPYSSVRPTILDLSKEDQEAFLKKIVKLQEKWGL